MIVVEDVFVSGVEVGFYIVFYYLVGAGRVLEFLYLERGRWVWVGIVRIGGV